MAAVALQWPLRLRTLNLIDEGLVLQVADDLLAGRRLYADAVAYAWPGAFWLTAAAFAAFGTSIETARTVAVVVFALAASLVYLIARWSWGRAGALGVVLGFLAYRVWAYPHWQMLNYSPLAMTAVLAATWLSGGAIARGGGARAVAAGAAAGVAALCKQDLGLAATATLGAALWLAPPGGRRARLVAYGAGVTGVLGGALLVLAAQGLLPAFVQETIVAPLHGARTFEYPSRPALWPPFEQDAVLRAKAFSYLPSVLVDLHWSALLASPLWRDTPVIDLLLKLVFHLPWLALVVTAPAVLRELRAGAAAAQPERPLVVLWCAAAAAAVAFNRPHDWVHLLVLYPPTLLLLAARGARVTLPARLRAPVRATAWLLLVVFAGVSAWLGVGIVRLNDTPVRSARGTLYGPARQAAPLQALLDDLATRPGAPVASWPYQPLVNFLTARPPVSRHYIIWPVDMNAQRDEEVRRGFAAHPDAEIVYSQMQVPHYPRPQVYAPELFAALADGWRTAGVFGGDPTGFTFLRFDRQPPAPGVSLLAQLADAPVTVTPDGGAPRVVSPAEHARLVGPAVWPFRRVLRMGALPGAWTTVALSLTPAPGDRFDASYGINPDYLGTLFGPGARFAVAIAAPGEPEREVFAARLDPSAVPADRDWRRLAIDLTPWAGRSVELRLRVAPMLPGPGPARLDVAGWGDPRLVSRASAGEKPERRDVPGALDDVARPELR